MVLVGAAAIAGAGMLVRARTQKQAAATKEGAAASAEARPTPVVLATVERKDVPVYLDGLGSVTALATVSVRTQIDGRLDRVLFKEGQAVKKGEHLAQIDPRPFSIAARAAEASIARDKANLDNAKLNLERFVSLRGQNLIPQQQVDDQRAMVAQLEATVASDRTVADSARLNLDYAHIVSPIEGVTGVRQVDPGNLVHQNDPTPIVVVTQLDPIGVIFTLPEDDLPRVAKAMSEGKPVVEAWSRDGATRVAVGELLVIDNQVSSTTATIKLKATFANKDHTLWPNQFVKARLLLATRKGATVIPASVVQRGPQGTFAYVVGADGRAQPRPVTIETVAGDVAIIATGLSPGESVVVDGQSQLRPGGKVQAKGAGSAAPPAASASHGAGP
jgi:multidrug efflux system membrane fusion protein